jgi:hypothetical protein
VRWRVKGTLKEVKETREIQQKHSTSNDGHIRLSQGKGFFSIAMSFYTTLA